MEYLDYINWDKIKTEKMSPEDFNNLLDKLNINEYLKTKSSNAEKSVAPTRESAYNNKVYASVVGSYIIFHLIDKITKTVEWYGENEEIIEFVPRKIIVSSDNSPIEISGSTAFKQIKKDFEEYYNINFSTAFGEDLKYFIKDSSFDNIEKEKKYGYLTADGIVDRKVKYFIKVENPSRTCVPSPINYGAINDEIYYGCFKADICSAYAYEASKRLPRIDLFNIKIVDGYAEPNEEFPFAFYHTNLGILQEKKENLVAIYGEDINCSVPAEQVTKTLLCPASEYSLKPIMEKYYELKESVTTREEKLKYKAYMNLFVGFCQSNTNPIYAHISAVTIARCNKRIEDMCKKIQKEGNQVILVNTDSIAWCGTDMPELYTTEKKLGNFLLEHEYCAIAVAGPKAYQILDGDEVITKYAGIPEKQREEMEFGDILNSNRKRNYWVFDIKKVRYKEVNEKYLWRYLCHLGMK